MSIIFVHRRWLVIGLVCTAVPIIVGSVLAYHELLNFGSAIACLVFLLPGGAILMRHSEDRRAELERQVFGILYWLPTSNGLSAEQFLLDQRMHIRPSLKTLRQLLHELHREGLLTEDHGQYYLTPSGLQRANRLATFS